MTHIPSQVVYSVANLENRFVLMEWIFKCLLP
jgi:hypothetical protein